MEKVDVKRVLETANFHAKIICRGFARTAYGALVAGLIGISVYGFICISSENGYSAVCEFVASCATLAVALSNVYFMGRSRKKQGKHEAGREK